MPGALGLRDGDGVQLGESCRDGMGQIGEGWCVNVCVWGGGGVEILTGADYGQG